MAYAFYNPLHCSHQRKRIQWAYIFEDKEKLDYMDLLLSLKSRLSYLNSENAQTKLFHDFAKFC